MTTTMTTREAYDLAVARITEAVLTCTMTLDEFAQTLAGLNKMLQNADR